MGVWEKGTWDRDSGLGIGARNGQAPPNTQLSTLDSGQTCGSIRLRPSYGGQARRVHRPESLNSDRSTLNIQHSTLNIQQSIEHPGQGLGGGQANAQVR